MKNPRQITYRVQVKDKEGKTLINKRGRKNQFLMRIDRPGAYDLKVLNEKDKRELVDSNFVIKDRITNVGKNKVIYSTSKELKANLKWKRGGNIPKDMEYVIKIYKSGNKKDPFIEKKTKKTNYVYKTKKEERNISCALDCTLCIKIQMLISILYCPVIHLTAKLARRKHSRNYK